MELDDNDCAMELLDAVTPGALVEVSGNALNALLAQHAAASERIEALADLMTHPEGPAGVVRYFIEGNAGDEKFQRRLYVDRLFQRERARMALDADYWRRALDIAGIYELLPQSRRDEWDLLLNAWRDARKTDAPRLPLFTPDRVRTTVEALMKLRPGFLAERVDGVFHALSGQHVTNAPEGFARRMIIARVTDEHGTVSCSQAGHIQDLRGTIAKFMGLGDPRRNETDLLIKRALAQPGRWLSADGNSLRLRAYKVGTVHLEIHPGMAWRLNVVLASRYPLAIPARFRARAGKAGFAPMVPPLPFGVRYLLASARYDRATRTVALDDALGTDGDSLPGARAVLEALGGKPIGLDRYRFQADIGELMEDIGISGIVPGPGVAGEATAA